MKKTKPPKKSQFYLNKSRNFKKNRNFDKNQGYLQKFDNLMKKNQ